MKNIVILLAGLYAALALTACGTIRPAESRFEIPAAVPAGTVCRGSYSESENGYSVTIDPAYKPGSYDELIERRYGLRKWCNFREVAPGRKNGRAGSKSTSNISPPQYGDE